MKDGWKVCGRVEMAGVERLHIFKVTYRVIGLIARIGDFWN